MVALGSVQKCSIVTVWPAAPTQVIRATAVAAHVCLHDSLMHVNCGVEGSIRISGKHHPESSNKVQTETVAGAPARYHE